ncbi:DUF2878 domain-containing protein [Achromobacter xylosoxidans]|uniref:DUF2878 domain-containing protein n=1 Tax=Alcaligenes xylosoxydans xylosoxydans TaxID=85698 RepID=UPI00064DE208|nr:DUF2878 domain-containing protein [Achromobacter xylosoxidans]KAA5923305.1 DUF2878 domain-containing protein [Achromobacter xylosoxidans]KMJ90650.1 hypothetical protein ACH58_09640 [Achromobacter xylosoxidans]MBK1982217.1 DUF2878 domain-containing protein [Achromobacter xylosoxidans]MEC6409549.1 DUF2878 domain-containing protein [Achromobacter xylosoxidans]QKI73620.1 DUF2878 domain-containing protein [Achromobacter xylosoxidans]
MRFWANLLGYQLVWFSAVIGAGRGLAWPGVVSALVFIAAQLACSAEWRADLKLAAAALLCGCLLDGALSALGWAVYAADAWPAPRWILALWAAFALTLNHSLAYLRPRRWLAFAFGAIGGPLAYWGAARGWQAVQFDAPAWRATAALALGWGLILPALTRRAHRWTREAA